MTHICVGKLTTIVSDNGLSPVRRQAIIGTSAGMLLFGPLGTILSEISIGIQTFSFKKMHLKMSSAKWRPFCLGLNVLTQDWRLKGYCSLLAVRSPLIHEVFLACGHVDVTVIWVITGDSKGFLPFRHQSFILTTQRKLYHYLYL